MLTPELTDAELRRIDTVRYPRLFFELVDFANEALLKGEFKRKPYIPPTSNEAEVVRSVGTRGLSMALDMAAYPKLFPTFSDQYGDDVDRADTDVWVDSPLRTRAELFSTPINFELIDTARQFGEALLDDAYLTLGPDVDRRIEQLKAASTHEDYARIFHWLIGRFEDIRFSAAGANADEEDRNTIYNPLRLSRHITGDYPHMHTRPTCLGYSIIAASFFEKAELDHLHAGIMEASGEEGKLMAAVALGLADAQIKELYGDGIILADAMSEKQREILDDTLKDRGYHAANFVRTKAGTWWQIDPNFSESLPIWSQKMTDDLNIAYNDISSLHDTAPGVERSLHFDYLSPHGQLCEWANDIEWDALSEESIKNILLSDESIPQALCDKMVTQFANKYREFHQEESASNIYRYVANKTFDDAFYNLFNKYVLWGTDITTFLTKCREDPNYLARRIEDIQVLQHAFLPATIIELLHTTRFYEMGVPHTSAEAGDPATRIGFAVLSDFAVFFDNRLPSSFWSSHWPSKIPITETLSVDDPELAEEQRALQLNLLLHLSELPVHLKYMKSYAIVKKFLPEDKPLEGGDVHGTREA